MKDFKIMTEPFVWRNTGWLLVVAFMLCLSADARALQVPRPEGYVNDLANLLSDTQKSGLESLLRRFEAETTDQVVLLIIPSLEGDSLEDFSMRVAEAWKVGQKGKDNGVIFLVAVDDRKARIEVGYGLEGALTDAQSGRILRNLVFPAFRQGDYYGGIQAGLVGILSQIRGEFTAQPAARRPAAARQPRAWASGLLIPLIFFLLLFSRAGRFFLLGGLLGGMWGSRGRGGMGGGGFGGFSGGGGGFGGGGASGSW